MFISIVLISLFLVSELVELKTLPYEKTSLHRRKSHRSSKRRKHLYGVSLSSITGYEKPMIPPHIIHYDLPINIHQRPQGQAPELLNLDLPRRFNATEEMVLNETAKAMYSLQ